MLPSLATRAARAYHYLTDQSVNLRPSTKTREARMPTVAKRGPGRPVDPSLTERRRAEILDAAAKLFARDGFADHACPEDADLHGGQV